MPLKPDKIKMYRQNIAKADDAEKAISYIATLDAEITVPVLSHVLASLKRAISKDDLQTHAALDEAITVFERADYYQNINLISLATKLEEVKNLIKSGLDSLLAKVKDVTVNKADLILWEELWVLLEGLHQRVFLQIKKDKHGDPLKENDEYVTIDMPDKIFRRVTGITKYDIALYYHRTGEMILEKIKGCEEAKQHAVQDDIPAINTKQVGSETVFEVKIPNDLQQRFHEMCLAFLKNPDSVQVFHGEVLSHGLTSADFLSVLNVVDAQDEQVKIKTLHSYYQNNGLTVSQSELLSTLKAEIEASLRSYLNAPTYTYYLFQKAHHGLVQDTLTQLELSDQPAEHLNQLFEMRQQLIGDNSGILLPKINRLLLDVFSMLSSQAKVEQKGISSERSIQGAHHGSK